MISYSPQTLHTLSSGQYRRTSTCITADIRPLTEKYLELQNPAIGESHQSPLRLITVFCLLLNKIQFEKDSQQLSVSTLSLSRATLCEILAIRVLREQAASFSMSPKLTL